MLHERFIRFVKEQYLNTKLSIEDKKKLEDFVSDWEKDKNYKEDPLYWTYCEEYLNDINKEINNKLKNLEKN
jgi:hemerythrin